MSHLSLSKFKILLLIFSAKIQIMKLKINVARSARNIAKWDFFDCFSNTLNKFLKKVWKWIRMRRRKQKACYAICLMLTFALGRWACSLEVCSCVEWAWPAWGLTPLRLVEALRTCYATAHVALPIISGLTGNWKNRLFNSWDTLYYLSIFYHFCHFAVWGSQG